MKKTGASRGRGILGPGHLPLQNSLHQASVHPELARDLVDAVAGGEPLGQLAGRNARARHHGPSEGSPRIDLDSPGLIQGPDPRIDALDETVAVPRDALERIYPWI